MPWKQLTPLQAVLVALLVAVSCLEIASTGIGDDGVWRAISVDSEASFRGLAVAEQTDEQNSLICVAGAGPEVWLVENPGDAWISIRPRIAGVSDYRSVAIASGNAIVMASAGTPAIIVRSEDRGTTWSIVHRDDRPGAFHDGLRMRTPMHGLAFGDPVDERFSILQTNDGGRTWDDMNCSVVAIAGEAGFAASNGSIALFGEDDTLIGLGGRTDQGPARVLRTTDGGVRWTATEIDCMPAGPSRGIFAIGITGDGFGIAVGGDYQRVDAIEGNAALTDDGGLTWRPPAGDPPRGFRSSVIHLDRFPNAEGCWLVTGPSGTDISDDGETWRAFTQEGFHALAELPDGRPIAIGSEGRVAVFESGP